MGSMAKKKPVSVKKAQAEYEPLSKLLGILSSRWTLLLLHRLHMEGPKRFGELRRVRHCLRERGSVLEQCMHGSVRWWFDQARYPVRESWHRLVELRRVLVAVYGVSESDADAKFTGPRSVPILVV